ncbi:MAG: hypothetical protein ACPGLY_25840 [Rubripirellula sp.]
MGYETGEFQKITTAGLLRDLGKLKNRSTNSSHAPEADS